MFLRCMLALWLMSFGDHAEGGNLAEQYLLAAANQERAARGIDPVRRDAALTAAAQRHAEQMALHRIISHRFSGESELSERGAAAGVRFTRIAENVAEGPSAVVLHDAWMHSAGHRENLLDAHVNAVGIAVVSRQGQLYAVQDFAALTPALTLAQQEASVALQLERAGMILLPQANQAHAACFGARHTQDAGFLFRYTTGDLATMPSGLVSRLATGKYHFAVVGACEDPEASPFSDFRLAILLYP